MPKCVDERLGAGVGIKLSINEISILIKSISVNKLMNSYKDSLVAINAIQNCQGEGC